MIIRMFTLSLEPEHPLRFSSDEFRSFLNKKLSVYSAHSREDTAGFIHRYPVLQCKQVKGNLIVSGISQGAEFLCQLSRNQTILGAGESSCRITARDPAIRSEPFGITDTPDTYEFLTPWLALNQQHAKKFYDLNGKPQRDAFMQKLLTTHLTTLAKSLDYDITAPITCEAKVRFLRERIDRENMIVFLGKFRTNLRIPDYLWDRPLGIAGIRDNKAYYGMSRYYIRRLMKEALLVIDVQNEYFTGKLPVTYPAGSFDNILKAMDWAHDGRVPVIVIRHTNAAPEATTFRKGTPGWELHDEIKRRHADVIIGKTLPGSFTGTNLENWLQDRGIATVTIAGYMTQMCCDTTARQAFHRNYAVNFLSDATGTLLISNHAGSISAADLHLAILVTQQQRFARVLATDEWIMEF